MDWKPDFIATWWNFERELRHYSKIHASVFDNERRLVQPFKLMCLVIHAKLFDRSSQLVQPFKPTCSTIQARLFDRSG